MNTPTHMLIGAALFARRDRPATTFAALAGGLVPDLAMLTLVEWSIRVQGVPARTVFTEFYLSDAWQRIFAVDHSFIVWGALFALTLLLRKPLAGAFAGAGLAHAAVDFFLHNEDARRQFWPLSDYVFRSPVSYWDPARYGQIVAPIEVALVLVLTLLLLWRQRRMWERGLILVAATIQILPIIVTGGFHGLHGVG
ncbi:MAG: hypothetical protein KDK08_18395 [Rhizobiaceae bacterium]|nr:hypothetical protein [Rhizobiaceae bacterium]